MTDLEITRLCAEAMECTLESIKDGGVMFTNFDPLHNGAQNQELVEALHLEIIPVNDGWKVFAGQTARFPNRSPVYMHGTDLKRTVCLCAIRIKAGKK